MLHEYYVTADTYRPADAADCPVPEKAPMFCGRIYTEVRASNVTKAREMGEKVFKDARIRHCSIGVMSKCDGSAAIVANYRRI